MMKQEFEALTGIYPTNQLYKCIEDTYMKSDADKATFCRFYKENRGNIASRIARDADKLQYAGILDFQEVCAGLEKELKSLQAKIQKLKRELEWEQEWKPYLPENAAAIDDYYNKLAATHGVQELSDEECKILIYNVFGFAMEKVTVLHTIPVCEKNRHGVIRKVSEKERKALYFSSDWYYILFECGGRCFEVEADTLIECPLF